MTYEYAHGTLKLTPKAWEVMRGKETVMGRLQEAIKETGVTIKNGKYDLSSHDPVLFEILRKRRKEIADQANLPPFTIFHDRTLKEMAIYFPQNHDSLSRIHGIGVAKLEKYGDIFIEIIRQYIETHQITEQAKPSEDIEAPVSMSPQGNRNHRHLVIGNAYQLGKTIEQLMTDFHIKKDTVLDNLHQYRQQGHPLDRDEFLSLSQLTNGQRQRVFASFDRLGTDKLRPVFDELHGEIDYDEIKILRLSYLCRCGSRKVEG